MFLRTYKRKMAEAERVRNSAIARAKLRMTIGAKYARTAGEFDKILDTYIAEMHVIESEYLRRLSVLNERF